MLEELLVKYSSPTLAGLKTGNIFLCPYSDICAMRDDLRTFNKCLYPKGIRVLPLSYKTGKALIYIYRPSMLKSDLLNSTACSLLHSIGYDTENPEICIKKLMKRLSLEEGFPHEVGLFIGYPPEDVYGFIANNAKECKCVGCWKVYGDAEKAQKTFEKYKKCTNAYCAQYAKGITIEQLAVAG